MNLIKNNPYRTVGLLIGATAREQERQIRRLKQYVIAEQEPAKELTGNDFSCLGKINRSLENIDEAVSKLNLNNDKFSAALFWFYNGNVITDEPAFEALKDSEPQVAIDIWSKLTFAGDVTLRNNSAFQNLSTLLLYKSLDEMSINVRLFEQGLALKLRFLESEFVEDFKAEVTDETFKVTKKEIQLSFLNALHLELEKHTGITPFKFIDIISKQTFSAKEDFIKSFLLKPIEQIEEKIEITKSKRKANKSNAAVAGKELYNAVSAALLQLKTILGPHNLKYITISDKVSDEILQCGIDYFISFRDSGTNLEYVSMDLFNKARLFAVGNIAKQRCQENTENLQKWIDEKPERDKQEKIKLDMDALLEIFEEYDDKAETIENAKLFISRCKPKLLNIKSILGTNDEFYLKLSTRVAMQAESYIINEVNDVLKNLDFKMSIDSYGTIYKVKNTLSNAWTVITAIGTLDMEYDYRTNHYRRNREILKGHCDNIGVSLSDNSSENPKDFVFTENAWWIIGIIGFLIGMLSSGGGGAVAGAIIGAIIGAATAIGSKSK
jgi:hypothetical protein